MSLNKYDWVGDERQVKDSVCVLGFVSGGIKRKEKASTYTLVDGEYEQKRFEEQNLERSPKDLLQSSLPMHRLSLQRCLVSFIACISSLGSRLPGK